MKQLTEQQRTAVLDLVVLAMYLDRNLATVEDVRVRRVLTTMGFEDEYDRSREFDAAVTRVRPHAENSEAARQHAVALVSALTTEEQRRFVLNALNDLVSADGAVTSEETEFLAKVRAVLQG